MSSRSHEFDFANILLGGPCNRRCPFCIGRRLPSRLRRDTLSIWPLPGLEDFLAEVVRLRVDRLVLTGTSTDPLLYCYQPRLLDEIRGRLPFPASISLHTNAAAAILQMEIFNRYDKACVSLPSFEPETYARMMGSWEVPDLAAILAEARIPVKLSCLVTDANRHELPTFLERCRRLGVERVVLRGLVGDPRPLQPFPDREPTRHHRRCPVYFLDGLEVTVWSFEATSSRSLNLMPDGTTSREYLLAAA